MPEEQEEIALKSVRETLAWQSERLASALKERDFYLSLARSMEAERNKMREERDIATENHYDTIEKFEGADRACNMMVTEVDSLRTALTAITRNQSEKAGEEGLCPFGCDAPWIAMSVLGQWKDGTVMGWAKTSAENWREKSTAQSQEIAQLHAERDAMQAQRDTLAADLRTLRGSLAAERETTREALRSESVVGGGGGFSVKPPTAEKEYNR